MKKKKRHFSLAALSVAALSLVLFAHFSAMAQPRGIHLSWNGSTKVNTAGTMAITWINDQAGVGAVLYGTDSLHLLKKARADVRYVADLLTYTGKATLRKLKPATNYYYKVGSPENGWSSIYKFKTATPHGDQRKFTVGIWSDTQNATGNQNFERTDTIVKQLSRNTFNFTLHTGDLVENGSVAKSWKALFDVTQPVNANSPFMSVTGNHDVNNDTASVNFQQPFPVFYAFMNLPNNQVNYSYDYGNVHFIAINSGWAEGAAKVEKVLFRENSEEYRWLENDLKKAKKNRDITWIILYSHYPVYSYGFSHIPAWQAHLKPLVDKYEVDLYLAGHRHVYERHKAIRGSEIFDMEDTHVYTKPKGTVYVTNGSCGGNLTGTGGQTVPDMVFTPKEKIFTYAMMTIEGKRLTYDVFDMQGNAVDHFTINK